MRDADFAGLQAVLVDNVLLGGEHEPNRLIVDWDVLCVGIFVISDEGLLRRCLLLLLLFGIDVSQKRGGSFLDLR